MHQVFLSKLNMPFSGLLQPCSGVCSTRPHRVRSLRLHCIIFHGLLGPPHSAPQSFPEGHQGLLRLSSQSAFILLDLCVAFRTVDSSLPWNALLASGNLYAPGFLIIYLAASLQSHLSFSVSLKVKIPQGPVLGFSSHRFYSAPRQCPRFSLSSMRPSPIYVSSSDLCSKLHIHMLDCSLHVLQILVDQHAHDWNHLFPSFTYLFTALKPPWSLSQEMASCPLLAKVWTVFLNSFLHQINQ